MQHLVNLRKRNEKIFSLRKPFEIIIPKSLYLLAQASSKGLCFFSFQLFSTNPEWKYQCCYVIQNKLFRKYNTIEFRNVYFKNVKFEKKKTRWNNNLLSYVTNENFVSPAFSLFCYIFWRKYIIDFSWLLLVFKNNMFSPLPRSLNPQPKCTRILVLHSFTIIALAKINIFFQFY